MSSILYYITGHGFGHAVRSHRVIRALRAARPELRIHVRTTAPAWLFAHPHGAVEHSAQAIDVGIRQKNSLEMDLESTLRACRLQLERAEELIEREIAFVKANEIRLLLGDIPPLCFEIAQRAGLPSVSITNFTWDGIYKQYLSAFPEFRPVVDQMAGWYAKASLALLLPYSCPMDMFRNAAPIPWIARRSPLSRRQARLKFRLPEQATIVLLSFGGLGLDRFPWQRLHQIKDYFFVTTGAYPDSSGNLAVLADSQSQYEDLVRAVDAIVTKPGYGIVADVIAHRVPMLYTDRGEFAEYPKLVEALGDCATAEFLPQAELFAGNMNPYLDTLLAREPHWPGVDLGGAETAAERVLSLLDQSL